MNIPFIQNICRSVTRLQQLLEERLGQTQVLMDSWYHQSYANLV